eukprot:PITA_34323
MSESVEVEPSSFEEAGKKTIWADSMVEKYDSIIRNSVWKEVPRPANKLVVSSRWLYKVHQAADGSVEKHNAIFVAREFSQAEGIDYDETFSPVARLKRVLYGLKQAPYAWYTNIDSHFTRFAFTKSEADVNLYHIVVEVWQGDEELFVYQGKYANKILKKFHMESSKPMETPLEGNWRKEDVTSGELVEATIYRQLVVSLMYFMNTQSVMCFEVN